MTATPPPLVSYGVDVSGLSVDPQTGRLDYSALPASASEGFDFRTIAELCYCCGATLMPSGLRWSGFFCRECHDRVMAVNRTARRWLIPIGRHSLMHQPMTLGGAPGGLTSDDSADPALVTAFVEHANGLFASMDRLGEWAEVIVRRHCAARFSDRERVPIAEYLAAVAGVSREAMFRAMCEWWTTQPTPRASYTPIDPATLLPDQRKLWDECNMGTPLPPGVTQRFRDDEFRYMCSLTCTPLPEAAPRIPEPPDASR